MCLFKLPPGNDVMTQSLNNSIVRVLNATTAAELKAEGDEMRAMLEAGKQQALQDFAALRDSMRAEGRLDAAQDRTIFAQSIAREANVAQESVDVDSIVSSLAAHYRFEQQRIDSAATHPHYNFSKRINDAYDSELLIYLADPSLRLLTCDTGSTGPKTRPREKESILSISANLLTPAIATGRVTDPASASPCRLIACFAMS